MLLGFPLRDLGILYHSVEEISLGKNPTSSFDVHRSLSKKIFFLEDRILAFVFGARARDVLLIRADTIITSGQIYPRGIEYLH